MANETNDVQLEVTDDALIAEVEKALQEQGGEVESAPAPAPAAAAPTAPVVPASPSGNAALDLGALNESLRSLGDNYHVQSADDIVKMVKASRDKMYETAEQNAATQRELRRHEQVIKALENPYTAQRVYSALQGRPAPEGDFVPVDPNEIPAIPAFNPALRAVEELKEQMAVKEFHDTMGKLPAFVNEDMRKEVAIECTALGRYGKEDVEGILWRRFGPQMVENAKKEGARDVVERLKKNAAGVLPGGNAMPPGSVEVDPLTLSPEEQEKWLMETVTRIGSDAREAEKWANKSSADEMPLW